MIYKAYCIYDKAIGAYMRPFFMQAHGQAIRAFSDDVNQKADSPVGNHPEDYSLFYVGEFDETTGVFEKCEPHCLARAHEIKIKEF